MDSFLYAVLPKDVVLTIFNEWLCSLRDFLHLDTALTNRSSRDCFFDLLSTEPSRNGSIRFDDDTIDISSSRQVNRWCKWEEKRGLCMRKHLRISNMQSNVIGKTNRLSGVVSLHLTVYKVFANFFHLLESLPSLERLKLHNCKLLVDSKVLEERGNWMVSSNITQLSLCCVSSVVVVSNMGWCAKNAYGILSKSKCWRVLLKIAQCCPKLQDLTIRNCYGATVTNVSPMIRSLPDLKKLRFFVRFEDFEFRNEFGENEDEDDDDEDERDDDDDGDEYPRYESDEDDDENEEDEDDEDEFSGSHFGTDEDMQRIAACKTLTSPPKIASLECALSNDGWEVMLSHCDGQYLRHVDMNMDSASASWKQQRLLSFIEHHWINLVTLIVTALTGQFVAPYLSLCLRVCQQLQELKLKNASSQDIDEITFAPFAVPNAFPHLRSLSFENCGVTSNTMTTLCTMTSSITQHLTSLEIMDCPYLSFQTYCTIFRSFPHLTHSWFAPSYSKKHDNMTAAQFYQGIGEMLDVLFGEECAFANTIQTLHVSVWGFWSVKGNQLLVEELYHAHVVPHWNFSFPELRSISFEWFVNHDKMSRLMKQRVLGGHHPYLHSFEILTHEEEDELDEPEVKNRPEVIRQLREKVKEQELL